MVKIPSNASASALTPGGGLRLGVDLGGSKIEIACIAPDGVIRARRRVPTPGGYRDCVAALAELALAMERQVAEAAGLPPNARLPLGIGMPGAISPATGLAKNANMTWLNGQPLQQDLERLLDRPLRFANDANCFTLSEAVDGAAAGARGVFGATLGTGVGGGLVFDGKPVIGANAIAGEWGHCALPYPREEDLPRPICWCGRPGCIETYLSGRALSRDYLEAGGDDVAALQVAARAADGEDLARAALDRYERRLAQALGMIVNLFDPEVIVLGGALSGIRRIYPALAELLPEQAFTDRLSVRVTPPRFGDSSGVRGAAFLWPLEDAAGER